MKQPSATSNPSLPETDLEPLGDPASPYLRTDEAARYLRFNSAILFRQWAARHRVPVSRIGRKMLYDKRVLVAYANGEPWTKERSA